jgi:hypothetical protein
MAGATLPPSLLSFWELCERSPQWRSLIDALSSRFWAGDEHRAQREGPEGCEQHSVVGGEGQPMGLDPGQQFTGRRRGGRQRIPLGDRPRDTRDFTIVEPANTTCVAVPSAASEDGGLRRRHHRRS